MNLHRLVHGWLLWFAVTPTMVRTAQADTPPEPRSLRLDEAFEELDRQNPTLAQARSRGDEAVGLVRQARAALLPTLTATGGYARYSDEASFSMGNFLRLLPLPPGTPIPPTVVIQPLEAWTVGGTLRVPLVVPTAWYDLSAAQESERAVQASTATVRIQLRTGFAQAVYAATAYEQVVTASERATEIATEHAKSAERRVLAGTAAPLDLLRAKTEVVRRESDLVRARAELGRARLALGILLGRTEAVRVAAPELDETTGSQPVPDSAIAHAIATRPDQVASQAQVDAASAQVRSAWARFFPQLTATGSVFASDVPYPTGKKDGWRVSVDLTWPLYDGGFRYGKEHQAEAALRTAALAQQGERLHVQQEIEDAKRDLDVARERVGLASVQQKLAADAAASAKRSFEAGVASNLDVLDANDKLYESDVAVADGHARFAQALWSLERALGKGR